MMQPDLKFEKKTRLSLIAATLILGFSIAVSYNFSGINEVLASVIYNVPNVSMLAAAAGNAGSMLTLSSTVSPLISQNYRVNGIDALQGVELGQFNLKSQGGDSTMSAVVATVYASSTNPITIYLYQGSTLMKSKSVVGGLTASGTKIYFDNLQVAPNAVVLGNDTPVTYTISADFPSNTINGTRANVTINEVSYKSSTGKLRKAFGHAIKNANQYVYTKAAVITLAAAPIIVANNAQVLTGTSTVSASFPLSICAKGGNVVMPSNRDVTVTFSNGIAATVANTVVAIIPSGAIGDGQCSSVTVTAQSAGFAPGLYNASITKIKWNAGNGTTTQGYGLGNFKTYNAALQI